ncbi:hypothetical protein C7999DRAFT_29253 [Corynascus novoguineensis]|uniref:Uncharacterized protein n=1 Tax=Corynascus novoguineensis TaxID=1126955 RepID=A0AAN7HM38_9PEZI|nr:hypothetical protein C7999DRAFT_29253 [Corynascus novoguineensis]
MSGVGLEVLLEDLIPEIAYSGEKGVSITELFKIVRRYHLSLNSQNAPFQDEAANGAQGSIDDADLEKSLTDAEMASARWAWDWLRSRPQILINGNKRWNRLELSEVLALPEADSVEPAMASASAQGREADHAKGEKFKKTLTTRPRIYPAEDLVWQTLTRHGVDYKRVPALEWACLQGIASSRAEGILQSDLRRLVDQDKRSLPKRTDSLARKGYIAKRTVVVQKMKTSRLWLIDFAPPLVEAETHGLDLSPETLSKDLEPVPWHGRWTGSNIDMDALGRTAVGIVKAFKVIRYADLRLKMGITGKRWQMKTLAKNCQRLVDTGVLKYTAASFPGSRKVFKDCLKFMRDPTTEEWEKFLATGKKTSLYSDPTRHREPKPNALALYGKSGENDQGSADARSKVRRIFSGWVPEKPLAQTVFEVIRSAGPEGASNPQVSVATVGYQHRRYLSSYLTKVAETQQPPHLKKFQVVSKLVRTGKTSAYMFSAPGVTGPAGLPGIDEGEERPTDQGVVEGSSDSAQAVSYGFGAIRPKAFTRTEDFSLSDMSRVARKSKPSAKRKLLPRIRPEHLATAEVAPGTTAAKDTTMPDQGDQISEANLNGSLKRSFDEMTAGHDGEAEPGASVGPQEQDLPSTDTTADRAAKVPADEELILDVRYNDIAGKLKVHRAERNLTFLRSGRGLKKPVTIPVDGNLGELAIQDVPESDDQVLVLKTGQKDGTQPQTYTFRFNKTNQDNAGWIQQEVTRMKSPDYHEPTPQEIAGASEEITVAPAPSEPARGKGRAAGRGKGKKGLALSAGAKPYVCELCGGAWKNDIGLKYHLQKAQVPCNPNFDPAVLLDRSRKRRRLTPVPPSEVNSEAGDEEGPGGMRKSKGGKKSEKKTSRPRLRVRTAMRALQDPAHKFRGLNLSDVGGEEAADWELERPRKMLTGPAGSAVPGLTVESVLPPNSSSALGPGIYSNAGFRPPVPADAISYPGDMHRVEDDELKFTSAATRVDVVGIAPGDEPSEQVPRPLAAPATPSRSRGSERNPMPSARFSNNPSYHAALENLTPQPTGRTSRSEQNGITSSPRQSPVADHTEPPKSEYPELPSSQQVVQGVWTGIEREASGSMADQSFYKPFTRSSNYERMTSDAKRRTAQAFDIINYLLDNNLGVFPGDKALFYALTNVFIKEFKRQMPPTWKNCTSAVKALENRKLATVHTHMLKTERGRLQTCTLLVRTGVDPNGIIATKMKQKMREAYPGIFIPPAFSPTQEELALLQELDRKSYDKNVANTKPNANGQKFRSRRKIENVEFFDAPYYKNTAPVAEPRKDPLWIRDTERLVDECFDEGKRSVDDDAWAEPPQKRMRTGSQTDEYGDIPVDPSILEDSLLKTQQDQQDGHSVLEAIKTYSLLPVKLGPRGGRRRLSYPYKPLAKLSPELGRARNPGLQTLPDKFFKNLASLGAIQFASPEVLILEPNTSPEEEVEEAQVSQAQSQASSRETTEDTFGEAEHQEDAEEEIEKPEAITFTAPAVLEPVTNGSWPDLPLGFFERHDGSFTLDGWMPSLKWLQTQNLPTSAEDMAQKQKGDKTRMRDWVDKEYARFCSIVNQCAVWEQSRSGTAVMLGSSVAPGFGYINVSAPVSKANSKAIVLGWSDDTQYDLETIPYDELEDDDYGDVTYVEDFEKPPTDGEPSPKKRRLPKAPGQARRMQGRPPKLKLAAIKTMREHTAYPRSEGDFLRGDEDELDWSSENVRLAAFVVVTTLLGGVDRVVDWGLMMRLVPDQTISQLRHYWCALKKDRLSTIVGLTEKFRRAFLKAYENNEIPPIDFDNVLAYDWKSLIKWTTKLDMAERRVLPSTRKALDEKVTVTKFRHGNRPWREAFYHPQRSIFNKFQDATSESLALPVDNNSDPKLSTEMIVAMSWTRSLCVTPVEAYTADAVIRRRNSLFPSRGKTEITELMIKGVDQLQRQGVISKSSSKWSNGRRWRFNTRVIDALEKSAQQEKFARAVQFKKELDQAFRAGETKKRVTYITNDGMIMALLNLQANGRVRVETTGQPHVPMGHEPGNYETRKYTKKYMHFRLDIVPTESYLYDEVATTASQEKNGEDLARNDKEDATLANLRALIKRTPPPTRGPGGAVPVWCDVFGKVDVERWLKYLSAVLITLASRGSMRAEELTKTLKPVIMVFEAELIMDWLTSLGLLKAQLEAMAPAVMEWWWVAVEMQREGLSKMAVAAPDGAAPRAAGDRTREMDVVGGEEWRGDLSGARQRKALPSGRPAKAVEETTGA